MERLPGLRVISRCGVGMDNVDQAAARELGIAVRNTPFGPTLAVAELAVGLALDMLRRIAEQDRALRAGVWKKRMGWLLAGKKVGVVGMGRIGRETAKRFAALGAEVAYADPVAVVEQYPRMDLPALLAWADMLSLHCSAPEHGGPLLGREELAAMRPGGWVINLARGGLVDEDALAEALREGRLSGAALDVYADEPYQGPLTGLDNAVLLPHVGSYAREGRIRMELDAVTNCLEALEQTPARSAK
jgi:D-3-phosphoglycerate dehydrogenase